MTISLQFIFITSLISEKKNQAFAKWKKNHVWKHQHGWSLQFIWTLSPNTFKSKINEYKFFLLVHTPLKDFWFWWSFKCFISNFDILVRKCYIIQPRKISKPLLHATLLFCSIVTESQSTSSNICLNSWRTSEFIFHRFINNYALCLWAIVVLEIKNIVKRSSISLF